MKIRYGKFAFHGFDPKLQTVATRHTALLLLAFNDIWKAEKAKHAFTGGFDPKLHFDRPSLLAELSEAVAPAIKKVLSDGDVYAHLLFLTEHKIGDTDVMVRNHAGPERPGKPIFQMGKAGEELADILEVRGYRPYIEEDAKNWAAIYLYGRLVAGGECCPSVWTPENIESLTGLNRGQINRAIKMLNDGFTAKLKSGLAGMDFVGSCVENIGSRRHPKYRLKPALRVSPAPEVDLDELDDVAEAAAAPEAQPVPSTSREWPTQIAPAAGVLGDPALTRRHWSDKGRGSFDRPTAADAFVQTFGAGTPPVPTTPPDIVPEDTPAEPVGAVAAVSPDETAILQTEAIRRCISLDSLVTVILKAGIESIVSDNARRSDEAERQAVIEAEMEEMLAEEAEIDAAALLASEQQDEVQHRLAQLRKRSAALTTRKAALERGDPSMISAL